MTIGAMVGPEAFSEVKYLMHAKQMQALDSIPRIADEFESTFGRASGGLVADYRAEDAETVVVALGSVLGTIEDVVDELRDQGVSIGALGVKCFRPYPLEEVREALRRRRADRRDREGVRGRRRRHRRAERAPRALGPRRARCYDVVAGLGGRPITKESLHAAVRRTCSRTGSSPGACTSSTWTRSSCGASWSGRGRRSHRAARREHAARRRDRRRRGRTEEAPMPYQEIKLYQAGTFVVGNRLLDPDQRSVQARTERSNTLTSGHRACQGCGEALGARYALDAAMRATDGQRDRRQRHRLPGGLLDPVPRVVVAAPLDPLAVRQRARPWPPGSPRR